MSNTDNTTSAGTAVTLEEVARAVVRGWESGDFDLQVWANEARAALAQQPAGHSNRVSVDGGALQLALSVLRRAGKTEVADALEQSGGERAAAQQPAGAPLQQQLAEMSEHANRLSDELQRLRAENERLTRERDDLAAAGKLQRAQIRLLERERAAQQPAEPVDVRRSVELAVLAEREACAALCESAELAWDISVWMGATKKEMTAKTAEGLAAAIRARSAAVEIPTYQPEGQMPRQEPEVREAPWPDFAGNPIRDGDTIQHPASGQTGRVVFAPARAEDQWLVSYADGDVSRLRLQIGDKGRAVVVEPDGTTGEQHG
jgi:hypothetical protein